MVGHTTISIKKNRPTTFNAIDEKSPQKKPQHALHGKGFFVLLRVGRYRCLR